MLGLSSDYEDAYHLPPHLGLDSILAVVGLSSLQCFRTSMQPLISPSLEAFPNPPTCLSLKLVSQFPFITSDLTCPTGFFSLLILGGDYSLWFSGASPCSKNLDAEFKKPLRILFFKPVSWHFRVLQFLKQAVNKNKTKPTDLCKRSTSTHQEPHLWGRLLGFASCSYH